VVKLIEELGPTESIYDLGAGVGEQEGWEETKSVMSDAVSATGSVVTVATA
jgi:hypothetical protein